MPLIKTENDLLSENVNSEHNLFDNGELRKLKEKVKYAGETYYYLFSLSGFTDAVIRACEEDKNLFLVDAGQIVNAV